MKKILYLSIVLIFASCGANESSTVNMDGREVSTIKIGNLEVIKKDFNSSMNWYDAKKACADLGDGWRLPSKTELNVLYKNKEKIGGFASASYWSSSEVYLSPSEVTNYVFTQNFKNGKSVNYIAKNDGSTMPARAVRYILNSFSQSSISIDGIEYKTVFNLITGKIWLDRNLGASQVATSSRDAGGYGDLYQWGRGADKHQFRLSATTSNLSSTDDPGHGDFIIPGDYDEDWRSPQNDNLWQGVNGTNNPCPSGYRLPTSLEWAEERATWVSDDADGAFASPLKLPLAGYRDRSYGSLNDVGSRGSFWSSTVNGSGADRLGFRSGNADMYDITRANGFSVRCLKD